MRRSLCVMVTWMSALGCQSQSSPASGPPATVSTPAPIVSSISASPVASGMPITPASIDPAALPSPFPDASGALGASPGVVLLPSPVMETTPGPSPMPLPSGQAATDAGSAMGGVPPVGSPAPGASPAAPAASPVPEKDRPLRMQVLLARAHFSPGEIDGAGGTNTQRALQAFARARGISGGEAAAWDVLNADSAPALVTYAVTAEDVAGPFTKVPEDMMEKAKLPALNHPSPLELLGEKFHAAPKLLQRLNPGKSFDRAGEQIQVPNVGPAAAGKAARVVVDKSDGSVSALDAGGKILARYPATMGSQHDPLPVGHWKINGVQRNPTFRYNPDLFWDADDSHAKAKIPPGPNNPVGTVWIDLSKPHYGIHGSPEPSTIGKTQSHGCIRLTNWDVVELAGLVSPGVPAILQE